MEEKKPTHRTFPSWSTRDSDTGKLEYSRYIHPLADYSFAEYMKSKQTIWGEYRRGDNRQKGIPPESLFDSLIRHIEIVKLLRKWHTVREYRDINTGETILHVDFELRSTDHDFLWEKTMVQELNAIRFNSEALKLSILQSSQSEHEDILPDYDH